MRGGRKGESGREGGERVGSEMVRKVERGREGEREQLNSDLLNTERVQLNCDLLNRYFSSACYNSADWPRQSV